MMELVDTMIPLFVLGLAGVVILWILSVYFPVLALVLAFFLYTGPTFGMIPRFDGRPALAFVLLAMFFARRPVPRLETDAHRRLTILIASIVLLVFAGSTSLLWSTSPEKTLSSIVALVILAAALWCLPRRLRSKQLLQVIVASASVIVVPSLALGLAGVSTAWRAGRLAGLLMNPNALAVFGLVLGVSAIFLKRRRLGVPLFIVAATTVILTASRGAGLSLIAALAAFLWIKYRFIWQRTLLLGVTGLSLWGLLTSDHYAELANDTTSILRQNNSRENFNQIALDSIAQSWPWGTGLGTASEASVNILFKVLAEFGPFGAVLLGVVLMMLFATVRSNILGKVVLIAGVAGNIFEGWLISAGNTFTILFFILIAAAILLKKSTDKIIDAHLRAPRSLKDP